MSLVCYLLRAQVKGHSSIPILECGGTQVTTGDFILTDKKTADKIYKIYKKNLSVPIEVTLEGQTKLKHGFYEHKRLPENHGLNHTVLTPHVKPSMSDKLAVEILTRQTFEDLKIEDCEDNLDKKMKTSSKINKKHKRKEAKRA